MAYRKSPHDFTRFTAELAFVAGVQNQYRDRDGGDEITPFQVAKDAERLRTIARAVSKINVSQCNGYPVYDGRFRDHRDVSGYLTQEMADQVAERDEQREAALVLEARTIAAKYGFVVHVQGDPRGWPLYLGYAPHMTENNYSTHGIGVPI